MNLNCLDYLEKITPIIIEILFNIFIQFSDVKDLLPEILQHLGPKQLGDLKDLLSHMGGADTKEKGADDEIPELETNFEEVTNKVD